MTKSTLLLLALFPTAAAFSASALAFRGPVFPREIQDRAVIWLNQDRVENLDNPIWVEAGDSLATSWANTSSLRALIDEAKVGELPAPGSIEDLRKHLPSPKFTWYAGSENGYGIFGRLEALFQKPWTIVSTALAGSQIISDRDDVLGAFLTIHHPERVKLVTMSLGSNDVCGGEDPSANNPLFRDKVRAAKAYLGPQAKWVVWDLVDVANVYRAIEARLAALPDSPEKTRVQNYCADAWKNVNCPAAASDPEGSIAMRERIRQVYLQEFGELWDTNALLHSGADLLDVMANDCFHPSRQTQGAITEELFKVIQNQAGLSPSAR